MLHIYSVVFELCDYMCTVRESKRSHVWIWLQYSNISSVPCEFWWFVILTDLFKKESGHSHSFANWTAQVVLCVCCLQQARMKHRKRQCCLLIVFILFYGAQAFSLYLITFNWDSKLTTLLKQFLFPWHCRFNSGTVTAELKCGKHCQVLSVLSLHLHCKRMQTFKIL